MSETELTIAEIEHLLATGQYSGNYKPACIFEDDESQVKRPKSIPIKHSSQPASQTEPDYKIPIGPIYIPVQEKDRHIIQAANQVLKSATERALEKCPPGMRPAIITFDTPYEQTIMEKKRQMALAYQRELNLPVYPELIDQPEVITVIPADSDDKRSSRSSTPGLPSDMDMAEELLRKVHLKRIGEVPYLFTGTYYKRLTDNEFHTLIVGALRESLSILGSSHQIKTVADAILAEPSIVTSMDQVPKHKRCLLNGVLDLKTMRLEPFNHNYFLTAQMRVNWYGPMETPIFDRFLHTATGGDPFLMECFVETLAYIVLASSNIGKRFCIMIGDGDTGKSLMAKIISAMFSPEDVSAVPLNKMGDNFSMSAMYNAQINVSMDLVQSMLSDEAVGILKNCTGDDKVIINAKYKAPFSAVINTRLLFGTNHQLRCKSLDKAFMNRVLCLPYMYPVPRDKQNPNLFEEILPELPGILYKFALSYRKLENKRFQFLADCWEIKQMAFNFDAAADNQNDILEQVVSRFCIADPEGFTTTTDLYACYKGCCAKENIEPKFSVQQFSMKLRPLLERDFSIENKKKRVNGVPMNGYTGIRIKE